MSSDGGSIEIDLTVNGQKFTAQLRKAENDINKFKTKWTELSSKLSIAQGVYSQIAGVVGNLAAKAREAVQAASEQVAMEKKLHALLKNRPDYSSASETTDLAQIQNLSNTTNFSVLDLTNARAQFATFLNIGQDTARQAMVYAADIAEATSSSVKEIAVGLSKALEDPIKNAAALNDRGIVLNTEKIKALNSTLERQKYILGEIKAQYGGAAAGGANELIIMQNKLKASQVEMGKALKPLIAGWDAVKLGATQSVTSVVKSIAGWISSTTDVKGKMQDAETALAQYNAEVKRIDGVDNLIERYEDLRDKANRNAAEQKELDKVIQQIAKTLPQAATGFDNYGRAIGINTDIAKQLTEEQRALAEELAKIKLDAAAEEMAKAAKNYEKMIASRKRWQKEANGEELTSGELVSGVWEGLKNNFLGTPILGKTAKLQAEIAKAMGDTSAKYDNLVSMAGNFNNLSESTLKYIYETGKAAKRIKGTFEEWSAEMREFQSIMNDAASGMPALRASLNIENRKKLDAYFKQLQQTRENSPVTIETPDMIRNVKQYAMELKAAQRASRSITSSTANNINKDLEALQKMIDKLGDIHKLEVEIKVRDELEPWFEKLGIKDKKLKVQIQTMFDTGDYVELNKLLKGIAEKKFGVNNTKQEKLISDAVIKNIGLKLNKIREEYKKKSDQEYNNAISDYLTEYERKKLEIENKYRDVILNTENEYQAAVKAGNEEQAKRMLERLKMLDKTVKLEKKVAKINSAKSSVDALTGVVSAAKTGDVGGITSAAGNLFKSDLGKQVLGKDASAALGSGMGFLSSMAGFAKTVGSVIVSLEGKAINITKAHIAEIEAMSQRALYLEQQITREIEDRYQKIDLIAKIYNGILESSQLELATIEQLNAIMAEADTHYSFGSMSDEDLIARQDALLEEKRRIEELQSLYQYYKAIYEGYEGQTSNPIVADAFNQMNAISQQLGIAVDYSSAHGLMMASQTTFQKWQEYATQTAAEIAQQLGISETELDALNSYVDAENQILDLEQQKTEELEKQLGLQYKISDEIRERLRALGNAQINAVLDEMKELELRIATNDILEGSAEATALRESIMGRLMALTNSLGETNLTDAIDVSRADLLKEYDEGSYNSMAGIMEKFGFAKGGFTGYGNSSDVAGFVHKGEVVLNADHTASLAKLFDVPAHDVASIIPNLPSLMGGHSSPVINLSQQITISGTSQEIIDKVSKTIRYDTLNVIDEALRRVGGKL